MKEMLNRLVGWLTLTDQILNLQGNVRLMFKAEVQFSKQCLKNDNIPAFKRYYFGNAAQPEKKCCPKM